MTKINLPDDDRECEVLEEEERERNLTEMENDDEITLRNE